MLTQMYRTACAGLLAVMCLVGGAQAAELPAPTGEVILTVTGQIGVTNADGVAVFDLEMLRALGESEFATSTNWTEGAPRFSGVALKDLMAALGVENGTLHATAINDYMISFPVADALRDDALVAFAIDGKTINAREKGPLWIVYPFDANSKYRSEEYYSRSIWQLDRIEIRND